MERHIEATATVPVPFAAACGQLRSDPAAVFGAEPGSAASGDRRFIAAVVVPVAAGTVVEQAVEVEIGSVQVEALAAGVPVHWSPAGHERVLPVFDGRLLLVPEGTDSTVLTLFGTYRVPFGAVGRFGDTLVGRRVARTSVSELLQRVARRLDDVHRALTDLEPATGFLHRIDLREDGPSRGGGVRPEHFIG